MHALSPVHRACYLCGQGAAWLRRGEDDFCWECARLPVARALERVAQASRAGSWEEQRWQHYQQHSA